MKKRSIFAFILSMTFVTITPSHIWAATEQLTLPELIEKRQQDYFNFSYVVQLPGENTGFYGNAYEMNYKKVVSTDNEEGYQNSPFGPSHQNLRSGRLYLDMPDGYEISFDYKITGITEEWLLPGGTIKTYYRAVPAKDNKSPGEMYVYVKNEDLEVPIVYDLPQNYPWQQHSGQEILMVSSIYTVRSLTDGSTTSWELPVSFVTNLDQKKPDCYYLITDDNEPYTVKSGDSLQEIAELHYGSSDKWGFIFHRNREAIKNPDIIYTGLKLEIPNVKAGD